MSTRAVGLRAEARAAEHLESLGYVILQRNFRTPVGEIDLVAEDGDVLCFVEVRSRGDVAHGTPAETISRRKRQRIARAAMLYLAGGTADRPCRFDVVTLAGPDGEAACELLRDAFRLEDCGDLGGR